jgi:hypothetical protein
MIAGLPTPGPRVRAVAAVATAGLSLAAAAWNAGHVAKALLPGRRAVADWALHFYHPEQASLLPWLSACLALLGFGAALHAAAGLPRRRAARWILRRLTARRPAVSLAALALVPLAISGALPPGAGLAIELAALALALLPAPRRLAGSVRGPAPGRTWPLPLACTLATGALLAAISVEPIRLATSPVRLANEYPTLGAPAGPMGPPQAPKLEVERLYQVVQRGQVNHLGQILNPIGELRAGKPVGQVYFQYGYGATRVFEWIMAPFGGPSIQAYYKASLAYVAYWLLFVGAAALLLRDPRHVLVAAAGLAATYYGIGYRALVVAPGINPILHFLDLPILLLALPAFRGRSGRWLLLAAAAAGGAFALNRFYGAMQAAALAAAAGLFLLEDPDRARRGRRIATVAAALAAALGIALLLQPRTGGRTSDLSFVLGWFSWRPQLAVVLLALAWLVAGYLHLAARRGDRGPLRYAEVYLFVYAQGFLVYSFWSGLSNHFWPVLPIVVLHLLVVARDLRAGREGARRELALLGATGAALALALAAFTDPFVSEKLDFRWTFQGRPTFEWPFPRARVISTADPAPLAEALAQVERHSPDPRRRLCVVSLLGNLLPFLSARPSALPTFELQWELWSEAGREQVLAALRADPPEVIFAGNELDAPERAAAWAESDRLLTAERSALVGRIRGMRGLLDALSPAYERVDAGALFTVYRRRAAP